MQGVTKQVSGWGGVYSLVILWMSLVDVAVGVVREGGGGGVVGLSLMTGQL